MELLNRMMKKEVLMKRENITIDLLLLSDGNPRLEPSLGEDEAIINMVKDQKEKLFILASDIVEFGFSPLDTIGVYPSESYLGYYEVGEGNRRIAALKLLINPDRIAQLNQNLYIKFKELSKSYSIPKSIEVVIFENEGEMRHWMEVRHMGELDGKGLSKWNSVQKMRFQKAQTGENTLLDFWNWMIDKNILSKTEVFSVTKTNWQRILREKYYPFLKILYNGKYVVKDEDIAIFSERINAIQNKLSGKTVAIVYDQDRIETFFNQISIELYGMPYQEIVEREQQQLTINTIINKLSDGIKEKNQSHEQSSQDDKIDKKSITTEKISPTDTHEEKTSKNIIGRDIFSNNISIIPSGYNIRSSNMRLNKIIKELKSLDPDIYSNACGTLLRLLFELSAKVFLEKITGIDQTETDFQAAIKSAANKLKELNRLTKDQHSSITHDIDALRKIFNGYMHNTDGYPSGIALKNIFKAHRCFIEECLKG